MANRKLDIRIYRTISAVVDKLVLAHGDDAITAINKYLRLRREEMITTRTIQRLEASLEGLKKVRQISGQKTKSRSHTKRKKAA